MYFTKLPIEEVLKRYKDKKLFFYTKGNKFWVLNFN